MVMLERQAEAGHGTQTLRRVDVADDDVFFRSI